jgi:hypothetical protein
MADALGHAVLSEDPDVIAVAVQGRRDMLVGMGVLGGW